MKALSIALNGIAIAALVAAAPVLAGKLSKSSRTVIRIDHSQDNQQPATPANPAAQQGSIANGTAGTQGLLLPAVQKVRASDVEPTKGGVFVATGDVNGDGTPQANNAPQKPPVSTHTKGRVRSINSNPPRPQQTSTQPPYQLGKMAPR